MSRSAAKHEWERPGVFEVADGVHRIPLPLPDDGLRAVNVYAVLDGADVVLIDSGWALESSRRQLERALATLELDLGCVSRFLITHAHRDHYTQAVAIRKLFGTRISLGAGEADSIRELNVTAEHLPGALMRRLTRAGAGNLVAALRASATATDPVDREVWGEPDDWLRSGMRIDIGSRQLAVLETPGHTRGHVVFHDARHKLLFGGDHVLPHITPSVGFETAPLASPLADYLASLELVGVLEDSRLLPAHGPVTASSRQRVAELLEHHDRRLDATQAAVRADGSTAFEVARVLTWTSRQRQFADLDLFNQMLAVNETVAHLEVLVERGSLRSGASRATVRYTA